MPLITFHIGVSSESINAQQIIRHKQKNRNRNQGYFSVESKNRSKRKVVTRMIKLGYVTALLTCLLISVNSKIIIINDKYYLVYIRCLAPYQVHYYSSN